MRHYIYMKVSSFSLSYNFNYNLFINAIIMIRLEGKGNIILTERYPKKWLYEIHVLPLFKLMPRKSNWIADSDFTWRASGKHFSISKHTILFLDRFYNMMDSHGRKKLRVDFVAWASGKHWIRGVNAKPNVSPQEKIPWGLKKILGIGNR
jgi:hypothetical protein